MTFEESSFLKYLLQIKLAKIVYLDTGKNLKKIT